jgi:hypothetical protein
MVCPSGRPHTRRVHPGRRAATHVPERIAAGFRSVGPTLPQKASPLEVSILNHINHVCPPTTHNVGLFPTISPSHIVSRNLFKNVLGQPRSTWLRHQLLKPDRRHMVCPSCHPHTRRAHPGRRTATHGSERIAAGFRSVGPTLP